MIKDRRYADHYIPITFNSREAFSSYPATDLLTMTLITDGAWKFTLNHTSYCLEAQCLSQSDGKWACRIRRYLLQILYLLEDEFQMSYDGKSQRNNRLIML